MRKGSARLAALAVAAGLAVSAGCTRGSRPASEPLVVYNAGSLAQPFHALLRMFARTHPGDQAQQESAGSLELVRRITELGRIPDVLAVSDYEVIPQLLMPDHAEWYVSFARNDIALAYTDRSKFAGEIAPANWYDVVLRPGVRLGQADPNTDPGGYRALLVGQLAERVYGRPGLARALKAAVSPRDMRPKAEDLVVLLQTGEIDYGWMYRSVAAQAGLRAVSLPDAINLGDPAREAQYGVASVAVAGRRPGEIVRLSGRPILLAATIPRGAAHGRAALEFLRLLVSPEGAQVLRSFHLTPVTPPRLSDRARVPSALGGLLPDDRALR